MRHLLRPSSTAAAPRRGFTLIELLVVIAIIAILSATLMPALSSATDRSRVTECRAHLSLLGVALHMYYDDYGSYPARLDQMLAGGCITDETLLHCTKTGGYYYYAPGVKGTPPQTVVAGCVDPKAAVGSRPHAYRNSLLVLRKGGKVEEVGQ